MRVDSNSGVNNLHFHDGTTCHGAPTLQQCADDAVRNCWAGKILEKTDTRDGAEVRCYSLIASSFEHWEKHGRFVAEVRQEWTVVQIGLTSS